MAINFTLDRIRKFQCKKDRKPKFFYDSNTKGLGMRITPSAKVYIFQARFNEKGIRIKIGDETTWTIEGARKEAARLRTLVDNGKDPRIEKQEKIAEQERKRIESKRREITLADAWSSYIKERKQKWGHRHLQDHIRIAQAGGKKVKRGKGKTKPGPLAPLMDCNLSELTPDRIKVWIRDKNLLFVNQTINNPPKSEYYLHPDTGTTCRVISNSGKRTPGVDNILIDTPRKRWETLKNLNLPEYKAKPLKRIYIPKKNGKKRPLGIPAMHDRVEQALDLLGLDPVSESTADHHSYGFRKVRSPRMRWEVFTMR